MQSKKQLVPIFVIWLGIIKDFILQFGKQLLDSSFNPVENVIDSNNLQPLKALFPKNVNEAGKIRDFKFNDFWKQ